MGAYSPVPIVDDALLGDVMDRFIEPTLAELRARGIDYRGVLYAGLMLTADGPRMLEYNVRFGDPETQVVVPALHLATSPSCWRRPRPAASSTSPPSAPTTR